VVVGGVVSVWGLGLEVGAGGGLGGGGLWWGLHLFISFFPSRVRITLFPRTVCVTRLSFLSVAV